MKKTITNSEIKKGDMVQIKNPQSGKWVEMWVECVRHTDDGVTVWGSWVLRNCLKSQYAILMGENFELYK